MLYFALMLVISLPEAVTLHIIGLASERAAGRILGVSHHCGLGRRPAAAVALMDRMVDLSVAGC
jgi:hypothetical protein